MSVEAEALQGGPGAWPDDASIGVRPCHSGAPLELGDDGDGLLTVSLRAQINVRVRGERGIEEFLQCGNRRTRVALSQRRVLVWAAVTAIATEP